MPAQFDGGCPNKRALLVIVLCLAGILFLGGCDKLIHPAKPNVILITLDTTRADRLGCYGYYRRTSPNIDVLAAESVLYSRATATSSWTLPSHASLFTGKFTTSHGARFDPQGPLHLSDAVDRSETEIRARGLSREEVTLAEILKQEGYATAGIVGGPWMKSVFGLDKGFDYYDDTGITSANGRLAQSITDSAIGWIEEPKKRPFFLFLNYFDPHSPYFPPDDYASTFVPMPFPVTVHGAEAPRIKPDLYDAEILYMDFHLGRLVNKLKIDDLYKNTIIIITADHGELLGEHGKWGHGRDLTQQELHVPLIIKYSGKDVPAARTDAAVQLVDILPIILERLQIPLPENIQGNVPPEIKHPILAETYPAGVLSGGENWRAIIDGDHKFIWSSKGRHQLFNLNNDPGESVSLTDRRPENQKIREDMLARLNQYIESLPRPLPSSTDKTVDQKTLDALKSLGYLE